MRTQKRSIRSTKTLRLLGLLLTLALCAGLLPITALAAPAETIIRADTVTWTGSDDPAQPNIYIVPTGETITLAVTKGRKTTNPRVEVKGHVELQLNGGTLVAKQGIHVPDGASLTITDTSGGILYAGCSFDANGNVISTMDDHAFDVGHAGIGSNQSDSKAGTITIHGGTVYAQGGRGYGIADIGGGAGIGGGFYAATPTVTITGGTVHATGIQGGAGIGGGFKGAGTSVNISGGTVYASGGGANEGGAGIGNGARAEASTDIHITGGSVVATGSGVAAGIGGGGALAGKTETGGIVDISGDSFVSATGKQAVSANNDISGHGGLLVENGQLTGDQTITGDIVIPEGVEVTLTQGSSLTVTEGANLTNLGTINTEKNSSLHNEGTLSGEGTIHNNGSISNSGTLTNDGTIHNQADWREGTGTITNEADGQFINNGTINNDSTRFHDSQIVNKGQFTNSEGAVINNDSIFDNQNGLINEGTINGNPISYKGYAVDEEGNLSKKKKKLSLSILLSGTELGITDRITLYLVVNTWTPVLDAMGYRAEVSWQYDSNGPVSGSVRLTGGGAVPMTPEELSALGLTAREDEVFYRLPVELPPKELTTPIHITMTLTHPDGATNAWEKTVSVRDYAAKLLPQTQGPATELISALLRYGAAAQVYFNHPSGGPADQVTGLSPAPADSPIQGFDASPSGGSTEGPRFVGSTLRLEPSVSIRHYFDFGDTAPTGYTFSCPGATLSPLTPAPASGNENPSDGYYFVELSHIPVPSWADTLTLTVTPPSGAVSLSIPYSVLTYCQQMQDDPKLGPLCQSMYHFQQAALTYGQPWD